MTQFSEHNLPREGAHVLTDDGREGLVGMVSCIYDAPAYHNVVVRFFDGALRNYHPHQLREVTQ